MTMKADLRADLEEAYGAAAMEQGILRTQRIWVFEYKVSVICVLSKESVTPIMESEDFDIYPSYNHLKIEIPWLHRMLYMNADHVSKHKHFNGSYAAFETE